MTGVSWTDRQGEVDDLLDGVLRDGVPAGSRVTNRRGYGTSARTVDVRLPDGQVFALTVDADVAL